MYCGSEKNYKYFFHLIEIWTLRKGAWFNFILTTLGGRAPGALPWICHCCEFNQSYQWDSSCILCLTCYLPVLKSRIYFKYSILFPMRQVRIDSLYCICHKHQCAFLPQSPVIHVAYRIRCKGGHLRVKLTFTLVLTCRMNHVYFYYIYQR